MVLFRNCSSNPSCVSFERLQCFINRRRSSKCFSQTWNAEKRGLLHQLQCEVRGSPLELKLDQTTPPPERTPHCRCKQSTQKRITFHKPCQQIVPTSASKAKHWPKNSRVPVNLQTLQHAQTHLCRKNEIGEENLNHESRQTNPPKKE